MRTWIKRSMRLSRMEVSLVVPKLCEAAKTVFQIAYTRTLLRSGKRKVIHIVVAFALPFVNVKQTLVDANFWLDWTASKRLGTLSLPKRWPHARTFSLRWAIRNAESGFWMKT